MDIVVVGSVALDSIMTPGGQVENVLGGSAVYFAWAASYFASVGIVGVIGDDFPESHIELLRDRGIDLEGLEKRSGKTFHWVGKYGENPNERETLSVCPNVFETFQPELPDKYTNSGYIFLANIDPQLHLSVLSQVRKPRLVIGDTMNIWIERKRDVLLETLEKMDMMILNDSEARQISGENNLLVAARSVMSLGPKAVIVKRGENGALLVGNEMLFTIPAYPVENVVDPTGAGDAFAGGVVGFIAREGNTDEINLRKAIVYGTIIASFCVEDFSLFRLRTVSMTDIEKRIDDFSRMAKF